MTDFRALCTELVEAWDSYSYVDAGDAADRMAEAVKAAHATLAAAPEATAEESSVTAPAVVVADPIRAALERLTVLARAELDAGRIPGQPAWERAMADALYALAAAPPAEGGVVGPSDEDLLRLMPERWTAPVHAAAAIQAGALSYARVVWAAAALAHQIQPAPPAGGEVAELMAALRADAKCIEAGRHDLCSNTADQLTRAAELLQQRHPAPVPVSERLPGPGDCAPWPDDPDTQPWCWLGNVIDGGWEWHQRSPGILTFIRDSYTHWLHATDLPLPAAEAQP